jgi:hypothetical protein
MRADAEPIAPIPRHPAITGLPRIRESSLVDTTRGWPSQVYAKWNIGLLLTFPHTFTRPIHTASHPGLGPFLATTSGTLEAGSCVWRGSLVRNGLRRSIGRRLGLPLLRQDSVRIRLNSRVGCRLVLCVSVGVWTVGDGVARSEVLRAVRFCCSIGCAGAG